jgi:hypothetical protein
LKDALKTLRNNLEHKERRLRGQVASLTDAARSLRKEAVALEAVSNIN